MKRLLSAIWAVLSSRAVPPLVCGVFLLIYIGIAFGTDDTLIALMAFTRKSVILVVLLALIPLNSLCLMLKETDRHLKRRRAKNGDENDAPAGLFDESIAVPASPEFAELRGRLEAEGYNCRRKEGVLAAWRGISIFPTRLLFLAAVFCLFTGILVSLTNRSSHRMNVVEGEPIPTAEGGGGLVERIRLEASSGVILDKKLRLEVAPSTAGDGRKVFELYPPSLYRGYFVYPRYLGFVSVIRFSAPGMQSASEIQGALNIYPPGKEDRLEIPGTPYQIVFSMVKPDDGSDPYMTGRFTLLFTVLKGKEVLFRGNAPTGGEFVHEGFRLAIPDFRRMVITDFIQDYGVLLVWTAALLFMGAGCIWLPVRVFLPRREMVFLQEHDAVNACSRAEGRRRTHAGVFHETLDILEARRPSTP
ncbi:hypothetical protein [Geobacter sp. AOG1]|uniref:hypothetical protein n=1 Tax=Geobacter sp. AOG1 TaxID=1566346 RepID=UPI001CC7C305|nr:hypothetical protein [Geobacter sp. AOG1]GFE57814.1 hypothetical protein AOG1_16940 [Geobacter sp. AOG1]